jgi:hypothetical protein
VSRIPDVAVERLDVVVVRIEEERGVVAGGVASVARRTVGAKSGLDASAVEASTCSREAATKKSAA